MSIKQDASQPSMAGMYIPPQVLTTDDFKNAAKLFISPDGHSARYMVETKFDPFSTEAMDQVQTILDTARGAQPNTTLSDATISMVGTTPMYSTIRSYYDHDLRLIIVLTLVVVFLILVALLRAIVAPLYLIASVVISYLSALGLGVAFFQFISTSSIYWNVPATAFIVLVAVGADYNLLLITPHPGGVPQRHPLGHHSRRPFDGRCDHLGRNHLRRLDVRPDVRQSSPRWCRPVSSSARAC